MSKKVNLVNLLDIFIIGFPSIYSKFTITPVQYNVTLVIICLIIGYWC